MADSEYLEAGRYAKFYVGCLFVFYTLAFLYFKTELASIRPAEDASQLEIDLSIARFLQLMDELLVLTVFQSIVFSAVFVHIANSAFSMNQFPPSATLLLKRTKIIRGQKARIAAYGFYALALISWLPILIPVYLKGFFA